MSATLPLDSPTGLRSARVLAHGPGHPVALLIVEIDGLAEPLPILAPPKHPPQPGDEIAVRENRTVHGATIWTYAGPGGTR